MLPRGFPGGSDGKESICNAEGLGSIPELGRSPGEGNGYPLQYSCLENPLDRCLMGYSPRGHKESDTTEQLNMHASQTHYIRLHSALLTPNPPPEESSKLSCVYMCTYFKC